ncbi:hypothetical protein E4U43_004525 [Claviceps pusilla]|uniref:Uncharacterized protein n=1 Tax=Claviceps pusilla TaxID=123648 RepID=A0A9P7SWZ0_9HYPO|nr:hypothetical protein E4U43_004525 [Claviceps pusilla]
MTAPMQPGLIHGTPTKSHDPLHGQFKTHKVLPRPRDDRTVDVHRAPSATVPELAVDGTASTASSTLQRSSSRALKHQPRRIGPGPELPPTPPNHSRVSSGSHPTQSPSPTSQDAGFRTPRRQASSRRPPATPPDQRSPPTPDVTPPQLRSRPTLRSLVPDDGYSCTITTTGPRTHFCKTNGQESFSFGDGAASCTEKKVVASPTTSQTPVRRFSTSTTASQAIQPQALDLALQCLTATPDEMCTPRTRGKSSQVDGEWGSPRDVEMDFDIHRQRLGSASSRNPKFVTPTPPQRGGAKNEVLEDKLVTPKQGTQASQATQAIRNLSPKELGSTEPWPKLSPQSAPRRRRTEPVTSRSETSSTTAPRRSSEVSSHCIPSTVIEAMLVDNTSPLQKPRTLRHMRKRRELREPSPHGRQSAAVEENLRSPAAKNSPPSNPKSEYVRRHRHDSYASATSSNSAVSGRARKEVWKAGGIPVVVIPDRMSSHISKSGEEPSLRSSSSRHSRTRSSGSFPLNQSPPSSGRPSIDRQSRWQRTMDVPPTVPPRSSSLSAPTTRTASRAGSLTAESIKALDDMHSEFEKLIALKPVSAAPTTAVTRAATATTKTTDSETHTETAPQARPTVPTTQLAIPLSISDQSPQTSQPDWEYGYDPFDADNHDETASAKKYSPRATPFSTISLETNWTAPEISEAQAVHMYPYQNSSILRINHSVKPQNMKKAVNKGLETSDSQGNPQITTTSPDGGIATPEQQKPWQEVDSPLRNPRSPPDAPIHPPAIHFIPATPSGLTPAEERQVQLGNFYEVSAETPPARRPSFVKRALSRQRRHSFSYPHTPSKQPGLLARTFSLSRGDRKLVGVEKMRSPNHDMEPTYSEREDKPAEQDKLHPHWRPQWDNDADDCDCSRCRHGSEDEVEIYRYPLVDNRPRSLKRSLSAKVRNTFTILPARQDYNFRYSLDDAFWPERRTIRRTPSGSLKVMRRRSSDYSLRRQTVRPAKEQRLVSKGNSPKGFWRRYSPRRRRSTIGLGQSSALGSRFEGMPSLTRRWSEKRREKRTQQLRQTISGPREVRDGVAEVVRLSSMKNQQVDYSY